MKTAERIGELMFRFARNELTRKQEKELKTWRGKSPENETLFLYETDPENTRRHIAEIYDRRERIFEKIKAQYPGPWETQPEKSHSGRFPIFRIAAILVLVLGAGLYVFFSGSGNKRTLNPYNPYENQEACLVSPADVAKALDDMNRGFLEGFAGIRFKTDEHGDLVYIASNNPGDPKDKLFEVHTTAGGRLHLEFPDGSRVWLNALTTIQYPANFSNDTIKYYVDGEAYFELALHAAHPSKVYALPRPAKTSEGYPAKRGMEIQATSARFNIVSYPDEGFISTTLLEGNVLVSLDTKQGEPISTTPLLPGQQARSESQSITIIPDVDGYESISWKNGRTSFKDARIETIMREIARLYDVKIRYEGNIPDKLFSFSLPRNSTLSTLLPIMVHQGIHFTVEGKTITVRQ